MTKEFQHNRLQIGSGLFVRPKILSHGPPPSLEAGVLTEVRIFQVRFDPLHQLREVILLGKIIHLRENDRPLLGASDAFAVGKAYAEAVTVERLDDAFERIGGVLRQTNDVLPSFLWMHC